MALLVSVGASLHLPPMELLTKVPFTNFQVYFLCTETLDITNTNGVVLHKEGRFTSPSTYGTSSGGKLTSPTTRGACTRNRKRNQIVIQASHGNNSTACKWVAIYNFSGRSATLINSLYSLCRQSESVWLMTDDPRGQGSLYFHTG